jgi:hypothetical protein
MKNGMLFISLLLINTIFSQNYTIKGRVFHDKTPIKDCNIFVSNTLNGTVSDKDGYFTLDFSTEKQTIKIVFSHVEFQEFDIDESPVMLSSKVLNINLVQVNKLDEIVIFSGKRDKAGYISGLSSLDLVTTPTALGDAMTAISTSLPGNQINPNDGRFFVRGGDHYETKVFINDLNVHYPFSANGSNLVNRGRFSPFLFEGIAFSAGGFEAEYGRALSSVLLMNTKSSILNDKAELAIKTTGIDFSIDRRIARKASLSSTISYTNLGPYRTLFPSRYKWNEDYNVLAAEIGTVVYLKKGYFKSYNKLDRTRLDYEHYDISIGQTINTKIIEDNLYSNNSLNLTFNNKFKFYTGVVYSDNHRNIDGVISNESKSLTVDKLLQVKIKGEYNFQELGLKAKFGFEQFWNKFYLDFKSSLDSEKKGGEIDINTSSAFVDLDLKITNKLMFKTGIRSDYTKRLDENVISPRLRLNYEIIPNFTLSPYYGVYYQSPQNSNLILDFEKNLKNEKAVQKGLNAFWSKESRVFFIDVYEKEYKHLVKYDLTSDGLNLYNFNNSGSGYAKGLDVFFWDKKSFRNFEYQLSYTYIDAKRDYKNFPEISFPNYFSKHNASVVTKYWYGKLRSLISLSYIYSSGNPYTNPNIAGFNNSFTKPYNSLNLSSTFLISNKLILHASVSNITDFSNTASYNYSKNPNANGVYPEQKILPSSDQFFFLGIFYKLDGRKNTKDSIDEINE